MAGTPAQNGNNAAGNNDSSRKTMALAERLMWPTATTRDYRNGDASQATHDRNSRPLNEMATIWSTPRASDATKGGPNQSFGAGGQPLPAQAYQHSHPAPTTPPDGERPSQGDLTSLLPSRRPQLNPKFVMWHMGYPDQWFD